MATRRVLMFVLVTIATFALHAQSLTGTWRCNDGGTYWIRQAGSEIWWFGRSADNGASFSNVFHGSLDGDTIRGDWADVPAGNARSSGELTLHVDSDNRLVATRRTGNFSGSEWTRGGGGTGNPGGGGGGTRTTQPPSTFRGRNGMQLNYDCPANASGSVWGTDVYTDDSNVCAAAIHAGVLGTRGGSVTIEIRPGRDSYTGTTRNGVGSSNYAAWPGSFVFVGAPRRSSGGGGGGGAQRVPADTSATSLRGQNGKHFTYDCPNGGGGSVWGTDVYTDDSNVCRAAVHAGLIGNNGGTVTIEIRPGQSSYSGSTRRGVTTGDYGSWSGSFVFVAAGY